MKSYTDIEQSKKLAKILPIKSADMCYIKHSMSNDNTWKYEGMPPMVLCDVPLNEITVEHLPCWSLAALLNVLESEIDGEEGETYQLNIEKEGTWWNVWYREKYDEADAIETASTEELINAAFEMIVKLKEKNLL